MKIKNFGLILLAFAGMLIGTQGAEQTTTITTRGTLQEFNPNDIVITTDSSSTPMHYASTKTTTYVDENGNPVSIKTVHSGSPVTIYYDRNGDQMVAEKVVVRKSVTRSY